jgi:YD repeat-containing protein
VRFAETWIPPDGAALDQAQSVNEQSYSYDALNRLSSVTEQRMSVSSGWGVWQQQFRQAYIYDRYGNRTIDGPQTWGAGINNKSFDKEDATNRLYAAGDLGLAENLRQIRYDAAGNQIKDTYTGYGSATFDADNRITAIQDNLAGWSYYTYNADGQRVRRKINNQESWQIYGMDGELLAEYPANGAVASPQKEYGYRNGQLLITASSSQRQWLIADHLGTPRMVTDQTGSLANMKRHDYLPFGEELFAGVGGRSAGHGYTGGEGCAPTVHLKRTGC